MAAGVARRVRLSVAGRDVVEIAGRLKRLTAVCTKTGIDEACFGSSTAGRFVEVELLLSEGATPREAVCAAAEALLRGLDHDDFVLPDGTRVRVSTTDSGAGRGP
ncbi:MAG: hypothetical protein KC766_23435 [Myxococcales bacterium]|nr:hypothetical protein [Myxococcales bacterium]